MYGILDDNEQLLAKFVAPMRVESIVPSFVSDSLSLKRNVKRRSAQRWQVSSQLMPLSTDSNGLFALFVKKGNTGVYKLQMPQNYGAVHNRVPRYGIDRANGLVGSSTITVDTNSIIPAGTFIQFDNSNKIYLTLTHRDRSGSIEISPKLTKAASNANFAWQDDLVMHAYLEIGSVQGMSFTDGILMDNGELTFVEKI